MSKVKVFTSAACANAQTKNFILVSAPLASAGGTICLHGKTPPPKGRWLRTGDGAGLSLKRPLREASQTASLATEIVPEFKDMVVSYRTEKCITHMYLPLGLAILTITGPIFVRRPYCCASAGHRKAPALGA